MTKKNSQRTLTIHVFLLVLSKGNQSAPCALSASSKAFLQILLCTILCKLVLLRAKSRRPKMTIYFQLRGPSLFLQHKKVKLIFGLASIKRLITWQERNKVSLEHGLQKSVYMSMLIVAHSSKKVLNKFYLVLFTPALKLVETSISLRQVVCRMLSFLCVVAQDGHGKLKQ
jgi:hypothetical protein